MNFIWRNTIILTKTCSKHRPFYTHDIVRLTISFLNYKLVIESIELIPKKGMNHLFIENYITLTNYHFVS